MSASGRDDRLWGAQIHPTPLYSLPNFGRMFISSGGLLTFGDIHPRPYKSRPLRGAFMRRREGGAGCGTCGCGSQLHPRADPGATPSATTGPAWVRAPWNAKAGKAAGAPTGAVFFLFRACSARPPPHRGKGKETGPPAPDQSPGPLTLGASTIDSMNGPHGHADSPAHSFLPSIRRAAAGPPRRARTDRAIDAAPRRAARSAPDRAPARASRRRAPRR